MLFICLFFREQEDSHLIDQMESGWIKFRNTSGASKKSFYMGALVCMTIVVKILAKEDKPLEALQGFAHELLGWVDSHR